MEAESVPLVYSGLGRGVAQPGSAPAWGAGGREFESRRPDQNDQTRPSLKVGFLFFVPYRCFWAMLIGKLVCWPMEYSLVNV